MKKEKNERRDMTDKGEDKNEYIRRWYDNFLVGENSRNVVESNR